MVKAFLADTESYLGTNLKGKLVEGGHDIMDPVVQVEEVKQEGEGEENPDENKEEGDGAEEAEDGAGGEGDEAKEVSPEAPPAAKTTISLWENPDDLKDMILGSELIILDLVGGAEKATTILNLLKEAELPGEITIVAVSSVMTWSKTTPKKGEPLKEKDYKSRKTSTKYKSLKMLETLVLNSKRENLNTFVVAAGILYGKGESEFHSLFQDAWMCEKDALTVIGEGKNLIPCIHISDLVALVERVGTTPSEQQYLVAVDGGENTQTAIVDAIAKGLGTGQVNTIAVDNEDVLLEGGNTEIMLANMKFNMEESAQTALGLPLTYEGGFAAVFDRLREEFASARSLKPLRILVQGAPGAGKTHYAKQLAETYFLPHIDVNALIDETAAAGGELGEVVKAALAEAEAAKSTSTKKKKAPPPKKGKGAKGGKAPPPDDAPRLPLDVMVRMVKEKLGSAACRNKGFILDGYPESLEEATALFATAPAEGEEAKEEAGGDEGDADAVAAPPSYNPATMVDFVVSLEVTQAVAEERMKAMDESLVIAGYNDEEGFARRWAKFEYLTDPQADAPMAVLDFFKTTEVLEVAEETCVNNDACFSAMQLYIETPGRPFNYHPTAEELATQKAKEEIERLEKKAAEATEKAAREAEQRKAQEERAAKDGVRKEQVLSDDQELVEACSLPLRKYLMANVVPPLVDGLLEVCKVQPEDPIDYLAEYLFKYSLGAPSDATSS